MHSVRIRRHSAPILVAESSTILESALAQGVNYPHSCQSGMCGTCKSRLLDGTVELLPYEDFALTDEERASGLVLACRAQPRSACEIAWLEYDGTAQHSIREIAGRVSVRERLTHDIVRVLVETGEALAYSPGQYGEVTFPGRPARDYSFAAPPGSETLEFHIRHIEGGATSGYVAEALQPGSPVQLKGPFGTAYLREFHTGPILAAAGGSGMAPIKAIVEGALALRMAQPIHLYFGVRDERDVYLEEHWRALAARHANLHVTIALSAPQGPTNRPTGLLHEIIGRDFADLEGCKAYAAGPPPMVEALQRWLAKAGMRSEDVHADAFYTEAEKAQRHR